MILDALANSSAYEGLHPLFPRAFAWLSLLDPAIPDGRHEIGGVSLVAIVQRYTTAPPTEKKWESHRLHGDIQFMVSGTELIGHARRESLTVRTPYNAEKDAEFYEPPADAPNYLAIEGGSFAVFLPQDVHQPGVMPDHPGDVCKVVVKFRI